MKAARSVLTSMSSAIRQSSVVAGGGKLAERRQAQRGVEEPRLLSLKDVGDAHQAESLASA